MPITLESASTHHFDLGHFRRQGAEELVEGLLQRAGFDIDLPWRLQVQKKLACNSETPPVRVVDEPKKWAVYLKVKPGDNNSCHYCSLLMPDGLQGDVVYPELKEVERELDRNWKYASSPRKVVMASLDNGTALEELDKDHAEATFGEETNGSAAPIHEPAPPPAHAVEPMAARAVPEPPDDRPKEKVVLRGLSNDPERVRQVLFAIQELHTTGFATDQDHFVRQLCKKLGWEGVNRYEVGGVFTSLVRKELINRVMRGSKAVGYALTDDGYLLVKDLVNPPPPPPAAPAAPVPPADLARTLRSFGPLAQDFVAAYHRLEEIAGREAELCLELEILREERDGICTRLANDEVHKLLARLLEVRPAEANAKA